MVKIVYGGILLVAKLVLRPCVIADFRDKIRASRVDYDLEVLNPLDAVLYAVFPFRSTFRAYSQIAQFVY